MHYTVKVGDTLPSICQRFRVEVDDVLRINPSIRTVHHRLVVGQVIRLPATVVVDCPVPEPVLERIIPTAAGVTVRIVSLTRRRIPERVLICRVRGTRVISCIVVIRFTCALGWQTIFRRDDIGLPLQFMDTCCLLGDDREQVIIGGMSVTRNNPGLCFMVLGWHNDQVVELVNHLHTPIPQGTVRVEGSRLVVGSSTGQTSYVWNGSSMVESR
ncbi:MAG: LysM domain-containing protein [Desulforudis sp.]|nr:LysM domain-containing protein [Clostridia bacterium]MDQ7791014.1 LysM domain-containing protein [Clostridia bacterium]RJX22557.1 MAG: LysM domain-containing protein [Desulforudis sp.]